MITSINQPTPEEENKGPDLYQQIISLVCKYKDVFEGFEHWEDESDPIRRLDLMLEYMTDYYQQVEHVLSKEMPNKVRDPQIIKPGGDIQHLVHKKNYELTSALEQRKKAIRNVKAMESVLSCNFFSFTHAQRNGVNLVLKELVEGTLIVLKENDGFPF